MPSLLWKCYRKCGELAKCEICSESICCKNGNTTGLKKHLGVHKDAYEEYALAQAEKDKLNEKEKGNKRKMHEMEEKSIKQSKISWETPNIVEKHSHFDDATVRFVAETGVSFHALGSESFKDVINVADRKLTVKHPTTISRKSGEYSQNVSNEVNDIIAAVKHDLFSVGFTTDLWTSRVGDSYISLTTTFIDKYLHMHRYVPFVRFFPNRHTGVNI